MMTRVHGLKFSWNEAEHFLMNWKLYPKILKSNILTIWNINTNKWNNKTNLGNISRVLNQNILNSSTHKPINHANAI